MELNIYRLTAKERRVYEDGSWLYPVTNARNYVAGAGISLESKSGAHFGDGGLGHLPWPTGVVRTEGPVGKAYINRCIKALARYAGLTYLEAAHRHRKVTVEWLNRAVSGVKGDSMRNKAKLAPLYEAHVALVDELIAEHTH